MGRDVNSQYEYDDGSVPCSRKLPVGLLRVACSDLFSDQPRTTKSTFGPNLNSEFCFVLAARIWLHIFKAPQLLNTEAINGLTCSRPDCPVKDATMSKGLKSAGLIIHPQIHPQTAWGAII